MSEMFITLDHPLFDAIVLRQGAQLIHFQPKGGEPLLWSAELSTFEKGKAFRGGIPICWPWFGKMKSPSHGFARLVEWDLVKCVKEIEGIKLSFELTDSDATRVLWPYAFSAKVEMSLGKDVRMSLYIEAEKESTAAFHTYLKCQNIFDVMVLGLGDNYNDALLDAKACKSIEEVLYIKQAVDRIYTQADTKALLKEKECLISIAHNNYSDVVVWNPWQEGAKNLLDMQEDDYTKMLCIETARITTPLERKDSLHVRIEV
ncbi:MAG: D-hexose-6-phosphate mutarotase [Sulfurospirillaceae bacterium]|nr:D-hexose-6-phosphate mutarotase [Sulfurospirillaceae bacterium]